MPRKLADRGQSDKKVVISKCISPHPPVRPLHLFKWDGSGYHPLTYIPGEGPVPPGELNPRPPPLSHDSRLMAAQETGV